MQPINKLSDIPQKKYQGYVWYSDEKAPKVLHNEEYRFNEEDINPYVVEALLYCREDNTSVMMQHSGKYTGYQFDLNNLPEGAQLEEKEYLPHRLGDVSKVCFKQLWIPEPDDNCEGMEVLTLKAIIFTGFETKNN